MGSWGKEEAEATWGGCGGAEKLHSRSCLVNWERWSSSLVQRPSNQLHMLTANLLAIPGQLECCPKELN